MGVIQDIDRLEKQGAAAIKRLGEAKRNVKAIGADVVKRHNAISATVKSVIDQFSKASAMLAASDAACDYRIHIAGLGISTGSRLRRLPW